MYVLLLPAARQVHVHVNRPVGKNATLFLHAKKAPSNESMKINVGDIKENGSNLSQIINFWDCFSCLKCTLTFPEIVKFFSFN